MKIDRIDAIEVLDSRGNPTIQTIATLESGETGSFIVPSGASVGTYEAIELRDGGERYGGRGVNNAIENTTQIISKELKGMDALNQASIDQKLIKLDGTENKKNLGANAILGASVAIAKAAANELKIPLYKYIGGAYTNILPMPMMNILNGGVHATNNLDFQEFMIMPIGAKTMQDAVMMCVMVYNSLKKLLVSKNLSANVGDEGGFAPEVSSAEEAIEFLIKAIGAAGYEPGKDISIAIDVAANELYDKDEKVYKLSGDYNVLTSSEMVDYYCTLVDKYPIISIEDGLYEDDVFGTKLLTEKLGSKIQIVGDDLFVTNTKKILFGIENNMANAVLIKMNQIGTLTETLNAISLAKRAGYGTIISHRSGDTEDTMIADLAVAVNAGQIKTGAPARAERTSKYNRLLMIEKQLEISQLGVNINGRIK